MLNKNIMRKKIYYPEPVIIIPFIWGLVYFYLSGYPLLDDYDTSWHISAGNLIRELGYIPKTDSWSITSYNNDWYNVAWLWDVLISIIVEFGGLNSLFIFVVILYSSILSLIGFLLSKNKKLKLSAALFTIFLITFVLIEFSSARPHSFTFLAATLFYIILSFCTHKTKLLTLPFLMAIWVNMHGGFIAGFILIAVFALAALMKKGKQDFYFFAALFTLCSFATLLNPYGLNLHLSIKEHLGNNFTFFINEWRPFIIGEYIGQTIFILAFILFVRFTDAKLDIRDKILSFFLMVLSLYSLRFFPLFAILSSTILANSLNNIKELRDFSFMIKKKKQLLYLCVFLFTLIVVDSNLGFIRKNIVESERMPVKSIDFAIKEYPNLRFLNSYELGGYIIFRSQEKMKVFIDGRAATAYTNEVLSDFASILTDTITTKDIIKKYNVQGVIAGKNDNFIRTFSRSDSGFYKAFSDENGAVFIRKDLIKN